LLSKTGVSVKYFLINGKGFRGYLKNVVPLKEEIRSFQPDIVHAHYGLSGLLANLQRIIPVITTFHGSDINLLNNWIYSQSSALLSRYSIFVSKNLSAKIVLKSQSSIVPSGVDLEQFFPMDKSEARRLLNLPTGKTLVLFAGSFENTIKNYPLAKAAINLLDHVKLVELKGYSRSEVNLLLNACDAALMTSLHEGSPQFIKESMACNRPVVSTNVGDVKDIFGDVEGHYIAKSDKTDIARKIQQALEFSSTQHGRQRIIDLGLDLHSVTSKIVTIYNSILMNP
jgi:glycosyltransferase involved in cell wall biosynthesis